MRTTMVVVAVSAAVLLACGATPPSGDQGGAGGASGTGGGDGARALRVFVTSNAYTGNLAAAAGTTTGLEGGDALCNIAATAADLGGHWAAWLSATGVRASDRITSDGPWQLVGTPEVAFRNRANLLTGPLHRIDIDEQGRSIRLDTNNNVLDIWTGTGTTSRISDSRCNDWSSTDNEGTVGALRIYEVGWTDAGTRDCSLYARLYCFEL